MTEIRVRHELECDQDTFWEKCLLDEEYNRRLFVDRLRFPRFKLIELADHGATFRKRADIDPPIAGLAGPLKKLIGDRLSYLEDGTYERATKRYTFKVTPSTFPEKTDVHGALYTEPLGERRCLRVVEVSVNVKVFAIGKLVEEKIADDLRASYDAAATFTNEFVTEKGY